jgi:hypothetical protein
METTMRGINHSGLLGILLAAAPLLLSCGCKSESAGVTRTSDGNYVIVHQDKVALPGMGMKIGNPYYTDESGNKVYMNGD